MRKEPRDRRSRTKAPGDGGWSEAAPVSAAGPTAAPVRASLASLARRKLAGTLMVCSVAAGLVLLRGAVALGDAPALGPSASSGSAAPASSPEASSRSVAPPPASSPSPSSGSSPSAVPAGTAPPSAGAASRDKAGAAIVKLPGLSQFTETAGVSLTLLDVEVRDRDGRPLPGLTKGDFRVRLDGEPWPIYSVDDLCACEPASAVAARDAGGGSAVKPSGGGSGSSPEAGEATGGAGQGDRQRGPETAVRGGPPATGEKAEEAAPPRGGQAGSPDGPVPGDAFLEDLARDLGESPPPAAAPGGAASADAPAELRYILYLDMSQLGQGGRVRALGEARRWIGQVKQASDLVMIAAYSTASGLRELCPFTVDPARLTAAIDAAGKDPSLEDSWPVEVRRRAEDCENPPGVVTGRMLIPPTTLCDTYSQEEYRHGARSLRALQEFLASLEAVPGRKALIFFNENGTPFPSRIYPKGTSPPGDHVHLLELIGAEATLVRTSVYTANVGDRLGAEASWQVGLADGAVALGSSLAEYTGGGYNLDLQDLGSLTASARRACSCIYRVAIQAGDTTRHGRVYEATVSARGRKIPYRYRVQFLDDLDRWVRQATSVLRNPSRAHELGVGAALLPVRGWRSGWELAVQVALDLDTIEYVPSAGAGSEAAGTAGGATGSWEAGALVTREDDGKNWEMLSLSSARRARPGAGNTASGAWSGIGGAAASQAGGGNGGRAGDESEGRAGGSNEDQSGRAPADAAGASASPPHAGEVVLHELLLEGMAPGRYTLASFVRDRTSSSFGGSGASIELPRVGSGSVAGPILLLASRRHFLAPLSRFTKGRTTDETRVTASRSGWTPLPAGSVPRGEALEALTWICPGNGPSKQDAAPSVTRFITRGGAPVYRLEKPTVDPAGECFRIGDRIETAELEPGTYAYTFRLEAAGAERAVAVEAPFTVAPPSPLEPAGR